MAGRARHSVRGGLGPGAYGGAHGVTRPTFPAVSEELQKSNDFASIAASLAVQTLSMATQLDGAQFFIWGIDQSAYGPVELPMLVSWIQDERVLAETWVFLERDIAWRRA